MACRLLPQCFTVSWLSWSETLSSPYLILNAAPNEAILPCSLEATTGIGTKELLHPRNVSELMAAFIPLATKADSTEETYVRLGVAFEVHTITDRQLAELEARVGDKTYLRSHCRLNGWLHVAQLKPGPPAWVADAHWVPGMNIYGARSER